MADIQKAGVTTFCAPGGGITHWVRGLPWVVDDGGRAAAGYVGQTGDCVCRAIAIAAQLPYAEVYELINTVALRERPGAAKRRRGKRSSARTGVYRCTTRRVMQELGWVWTPTMGIGTGCRVHVREGELPTRGRYVLALSRHAAALVDGVIHDLDDPSRCGMRCVYGHWSPAGK